MPIGRANYIPPVLAAVLMLVACAVLGIHASWGPREAAAQISTSPITPDAAVAQRLAEVERRLPSTTEGVVALALAFLAGSSKFAFSFRRTRGGGS